MSSQPSTAPDLEKRLRDPKQARAAFSEAITAFTEPLYWQIRRLVNNHDDTNDLLQNTFLKAWQNLENFRGEARLATWLHKIAINESLTFLDRQKRHETTSLDTDNAAIKANSVAADTMIDGDTLALKLRQAIETLPPKQQLVFNMRYYDEMKYEEISAILGTSVGALKASYHLATKKIEKYLRDED